MFCQFFYCFIGTLPSFYECKFICQNEIFLGVHDEVNVIIC